MISGGDSMAEIKIITLDGLRKFKEMLDYNYTKKFADNDLISNVATDDEVERLFDEIFDGNYTPSEQPTVDFATDEEVDNLLDDIFD